MRKPAARLVPILAIILCLSASAQAETLSQGDTAIDFSAMTLDGEHIVLSSAFAGRLIFMDFWATWCEPCMEEVPGIVAAYKKYGSRIGFIGVTLDTPGDKRDVIATMKKQGMTWPQIFDDESDVDGITISKAYRVMDEGIPCPLLIDGDTGLIVASGSRLRGAALMRTLEAELAKKQ